MLNAISQYKALKDSSSLIFAYQGDIDDKLISQLMNIIENKLGMVEYNSRLKKKIFNIIVELIQNVFHNYEENIGLIPESLNQITLAIVKNDEDYEVLCGNYMVNTDILPLETSIKEVNSMSIEELRAHYRDRLDKGVISSKGRAGLGIMDIVRKANNPLHYAFDQQDSKLSLLSLKVKIDINS